MSLPLKMLAITYVHISIVDLKMKLLPRFSISIEHGFYVLLNIPGETYFEISKFFEKLNAALGSKLGSFCLVTIFYLNK